MPFYPDAGAERRASPAAIIGDSPLTENERRGDAAHVCGRVARLPRCPGGARASIARSGSAGVVCRSGRAARRAEAAGRSGAAAHRRRRGGDRCGCTSCSTRSGVRARRRRRRCATKPRASATRRWCTPAASACDCSGFLQVDAVAWSQASQDQLNPSTGEPLNQTRFLIRRARLRAEVDWRMLAGAVELDGNTVNGYQARLIGAEASLVWRNPTRAGAALSAAHRRQLQDSVRLRGRAARHRSPVPRALERWSAPSSRANTISARASAAAGASCATRSRP